MHEDLPKSRSEAVSLGVKFYFTGNPCAHGHIDRRRINGGCQKCWQAIQKKNRRERVRLGKEQRRLREPAG